MLHLEFRSIKRFLELRFQNLQKIFITMPFKSNKFDKALVNENIETEKYLYFLKFLHIYTNPLASETEMPITQY